MVIQCQNLSLSDRHKTVLENLNLNLPDRQITALYGPTGSGKTVLLLILAGLIKPSTGKVLIDGIDVVKKPRMARRKIGLGVIPDFSPLISKLTLKENLQIQAKILQVPQPENRVQDLLKYFDLTDYAGTLTENLPAYITSKASIALALLNDSSVLLLDEPEYRLTSEETETIWSYLRELKQTGKSIVISTRYQEVAAKCDAMFNIALGKVVDPHETDSVGLVRTQTAFA
ncbi:MAG: ABC transporter ATP-binding protein [Bacillota bacterium]|nr:ABC transporter ATP-binding protein [Bacillota bacterium]MDP4160269.1 ABC transporter ATP-binding protein [Bacillota bacterium]